MESHESSTVEPQVISARSALRPCVACGNDIAVSAASCPRCGASNNFEHPKIAEFKKQQFVTKKPFSYEATGTKISGKSESASESMKQWSGLTIVAAAVCGFFLPVFAMPLLGLSMILLVVALLSSDKAETFVVDFASGQAEWNSSNDELFEPIKAFFME